MNLVSLRDIVNSYYITVGSVPYGRSKKACIKRTSKEMYGRAIPSIEFIVVVVGKNIVIVEILSVGIITNNVIIISRNHDRLRMWC